MLLRGVSLEEIREYSTYDASLDAYVFKLGDRLEVKSMVKNHCNNLLSDSLSKNVIRDSLMVKYSPSNQILFDVDLVESSDVASVQVSWDIDRYNKQLRVGVLHKYRQQRGVLMMSGRLSANGYVEKHYDIRSGNQLRRDLVINKIPLLSVGMRDDKLYGVFCVPNERSIAYDIKDGLLAYSTVTRCMIDCRNWGQLIIDDWFLHANVSIIHEE